LSKSWPINYPPGPSSRLPLKLLFDFLLDPLTVLHNLSKEYGDISHFKFGKHHIYLVNNPDYIKDVLVNYENNFIKSRGLQLAKRILGEGLLTSEGEIHHRQRQLIQPIFHPDEIPNYANIMTDYTLDISSQWHDQATIDIHKEFMHLALAIVSKIFFNISIKESEIKEIDQYVTTIIEHFNRARMPFAGIIEKVPIPSNIQFYQAKKHLDEIIYRIIDNHITNNSDNNDYNQQQNGSQARKDLISLLLQGQDNAYFSTSKNNEDVNKTNRKKFDNNITSTN
jgi:cytochrome P450